MPTAEELISGFNGIKTIPHVAIRLSQLVSDESTTVNQFEEVIRMDPTLVARLLRMANSPYFGLRQKIDSISRAVVYIGVKHLRNMVMVDVLKDIFKDRLPEGLFSRRRLWLHSSAVGVCSQMLSERIFMQKGEDAFLCGILHDIGMILEDQMVPELFLSACNQWQQEETPFVDCEKAVIGADHCTVGFCLAKEWKFTQEIQDTILHHHDTMDQVSPSSLSGIIQSAEYIVSKMDYPALPGMQVVLSPPLFNHIRENLQEYKTLSKDLPDELKKAEDLYTD